MLIVLFAYYNGDLKKTLTPATVYNSAELLTGAPIISPKVKQHILYGDRTGGGHKYGMNKPCKSEFPKSWNDDKIISNIKRVASNDNAKWKEQHNGYYVSEIMEEGVKIRVVLGDKKRNIITAYPVETKRNPCPANDN